MTYDGDKNITEVDSAQVQKLADEGVKLIDVRPRASYDEGHIPGAISVPIVKDAQGDIYSDSEFMNRVRAVGIDPNDPVVVYCQTGYHAGLASHALSDEHYTHIYYYKGSMNDWNAHDLPVETSFA